MASKALGRGEKNSLDDGELTSHDQLCCGCEQGNEFGQDTNTICGLSSIYCAKPQLQQGFYHDCHMRPFALR